MASRKLSNREFVLAMVGCKSITEIAEKTGYSETSVQQKRVLLRKEGWPIVELDRGVKATGTRKSHAPSLEDMAALAEATGQTVEDLQLESVKVVTVQAERSEKIRAGQAAARAAVVVDAPTEGEVVAPSNEVEAPAAE